MDLEVLKSYLVDLGFEINQPQLRKFEHALKEAGEAVTSRTAGIVKDVLKWQVAITGAFTGIATGVVGIADSVADADQKYRLLGLRMGMTTSEARKFQKALDALGATQEEIAADPELHARFLQLIDLQGKLEKGLGAQFGADMRKIRDLRFEFTKMKMSFDYFVMSFVMNLAEKLKPQIEQIQSKLEGWGNYIVEHVPEWGDYLAKHMIPVLKQTWTMLQEIGKEAQALGVVLLNALGKLFGDKSLEGTELSFEKIAKAIEHVVTWIGTMTVNLMKAEEMLLHFAAAASLAMNDRFADAKKEFQEGLKALDSHSGALLGTFVGGGTGAGTGAALGGSLGSLILPGPGTAVGAGIGFVIGGLWGAKAGHDIGKAEGGKAEAREIARLAHENSQASIKELITRTAEKYGLDPKTALAVAEVESRFRQFDKPGHVYTSGKGAQGVMQLMPATARGLHVDASKTDQNIDGGIRLLVELLQRYHNDVPKALAAYNWNPKSLDEAIKNGGKLPPETENYVRSIASNLSGQTVTIEQVNISVLGSPNMPPAELQKKVADGMAEALVKQHRQMQLSMVQFGFAGG